ncbi:MAG: T9SS C-terminal target domain-containing protein [Flavobacteriaceae bacterium]
MKKLKLLYCFLLFSPVVVGQQTVTLEGTLPVSVGESSGLIYYNGKLITHNDSGNEATLIEIEPASRDEIRVVRISNAENVDWEDITQDDTYIYIGDIGNINGNRTDLGIYRIRKSDYDSSDSVTADWIGFSYSDQQSFLATPNSDWDAEAITIIRGQLTVFTKRWKSGGTTAYTVPNSPGEHSALNIGTSMVSGLVTAATYNPFSNILYILGYSQFLQPFVVRFQDPPGPQSFGGTGQQINLDIGFGQAEGMCFVDHNTYYISTERFENSSPPVVLAASLFKLKTEDDPVEVLPPAEEDPIPDPDEDPKGNPDPNEEIDDELIIFRTFGSSVLRYVLNTQDDVFGMAIYDVKGRRIRYTSESDMDRDEIDISTLESSIYYLTFYLRTKILSKAFISY